MEDRFKFRAWNKSQKKIFTYEQLKSMSYLVGDASVIDSGVFYPFEMDDMIFMPCTGLKDKNGNLIYEGDILRDDGSEYVEGAISRIHWRKVGYWEAEIRSLEEPNDIQERLILSEVSEYGYVCGNVYENPDFLEAPNDSN